MASVTSDVPLSIGKFRIDVARHEQHHARGFLFRIIVTGKVALHVAERALNAECCAERTHRHDDLLSTLTGQDLQVLGSGRRALLPFFLLGAETDGDKQQHNR